MYQIPQRRARTELVVKKSRFVATADYTASRDEMMAFLKRVQQEFPDARHHCWAYLLGAPHSPASAAMSDDGEPSGTAGKPILNVLQHKSIGDVTVIVSRYFGGIKLGAGGLVRAYSGATQAVIDQLPTRPFVQLEQCVIHLNYEHEQWLRHWLSEHDGEVLDVNYDDGVMCTIAIPSQKIDALTIKLNEKGLVLGEVE